jgi:hypothetical protein
LPNNKESYIKYVKKICKKYYPNLILDMIECVETSNFDHKTNSWTPYGYCIFISVKQNIEYNRYDMENFIESIMGSELIITEQ